MAILRQNDETGYWTELGDGYVLANTHNPKLCKGRGCAIHNHPSDHPLKEAPLNWREDRGILERICKHGVCHPDLDAALYLASIGKGVENVHGCCVQRCCF